MEGSWKVQGRYIAAEYAAEAKVQGRFMEGSRKVHGRFKEGSRKVPLTSLPSTPLRRIWPGGRPEARKAREAMVVSSVGLISDGRFSAGAFSEGRKVEAHPASVGRSLCSSAEAVACVRVRV